jgi:hypothetical protein
MPAASGTYFDNLDGWVMDDSKIVTYRYISNELGVSSDIAKRMLFAYAQARKGKVSATCLVSGLAAPKGEALASRVFRLVPWSCAFEGGGELDANASIHVYAVQSVGTAKTAASSEGAAAKGDENAGTDTEADAVHRALIARQDAMHASDTAQRMQLFVDSSDAGAALRSNSYSRIVARGIECAAAPRRAGKGAPLDAKKGAAKTASSQKRSFDPFKMLDVPKSSKKKKTASSFFKAKPEIASTGKSAAHKDADGATKDAAPKARSRPKKRGIASFFGSGPGAKTDPFAKTAKKPKKVPSMLPEPAAMAEDEDEEDEEEARGLAALEEETAAIDAAETAAEQARRAREEMLKKQRKKRRGLRSKRVADSDDDVEDVDEVQRLRTKQDEENDLDSAAGSFDNRTEADLEAARAQRRAAIEAEHAAAAEKVRAAAEADRRNGPKAKLRKKLVKKTYEDEEGFLVTEEVWVDDDSADAEETDAGAGAKRVSAAAQSLFGGSKDIVRDDAPSPKKRATKKRKASDESTRSASKPKKKQGGLMSFFKKK